MIILLDFPLHCDLESWIPTLLLSTDIPVYKKIWPKHYGGVSVQDGAT